MPTDPVTAIASAVEATAKLITLVIEDMPKEDRVQAWHRWFAFWERLAALATEVK